MKKLIIYLFAVVAISVSACKGTDKKDDNATADTGQVHVGSEGPADTAQLSTTPVETGGKDTSGNGVGNTNVAKDTLRTNP